MLNAAQRCPKCGAALTSDAFEGLCPACIVHVMAPTMAAAKEKPGDRIRRYKLLEKIGEGGCGTVYLAEQEEPVRRCVALKVIKLGMDTEQVIARFQAELQALALMDHPNIAKVFDAGTTAAGRPFFVMELVRGLPITEFCDRNQLPARERLHLFLQVCHAIQHAHQKGVIHRDIKPSNVLVTQHDGVATPKVIDFGIAKATTGQRLTDKTVFTAFEQFLGTPAYMSPEQAEMSAVDIDTRSDIYSLGVLLYELLTGLTPFDAKELVSSGLDAMRKTIREKEPPRPSTRLNQEVVAAERRLRSTSAADTGTEEEVRASSPRLLRIKETITLLRGDLDWIVMKCLEKDRTRRYETANGLAADLKRHLNQEPVIARPTSAGYRLQKMVRRHKIAFAATAAVAAALLIGMVTALWQAGVAKRAARELEANLYLTRLAAAQHELSAEPPNILQAENLLDACKPEMRDWEWLYLKRLRLVDPVLLHDPGTDGVNSISFSADGRFVASAGADGNVRIWNISASPTPQAPVQTLAAHPGFAFCVAFHPTDATRLVTAGSDKKVKLWDLNTAKVIASWPCAFSFEWGLAYAVVFSPDGQRLAFSSEPDTVAVVSTATFQRMQTLSFVPPRPVFSLAFSPDGRHLASGHGGGFVRVWDVASGRCLKTLGQAGPPIGCVAFSRDGRHLASAGFDHSVQVWSMGDLDARPLRFQAHTDLVVGLAFSADSHRLATAGHDRTVNIWNPNTGQQVLTFRSFAKETCVAFSRDGTHLAASSMDGTIQLWDATPLAGSGDSSHYTLPHAWPIAAMDISQDGSRLATGARVTQAAVEKDLLLIWDTATGRRLQAVPGQTITTFGLAFSPDGRFIASVGDDQDAAPGVHAVKVFDLNTGQAAFSTEPFQGVGVLFCLAFSPDGRRVVAAGQDKQLKVWDAATGRKVGIMGEHDRNVFNLAFSPDGRFLASAGKDGMVRLWDGTRLDEHQTHFREIGRATGEIADAIAFSPDSTRFAAASSDLTATIWDVQSGARLLALPHLPAHAFRALAFSPDGRWLASGGIDSAVKVWDARTGMLLQTLRGHQGSVTRLKFVKLADGLHLASGSLDHTVKLWDTARWSESAPR